MFIRLRWRVLLCLGIGASTALSASAAQDEPTTDGIVVVQGAADPLAGGGADRRTVIGLGFTVGPDLVVAYLPEDHGESLTVLDANGGELNAALRFRDPSSGLGLLNVPGLDTPPYSFVPEGGARPEEEIWGIARAPVPDDENRLLLEEGSVRAGADPSSDPLAPIEVVDLGAAGFNLGAPVLNECGQVIGALSNNNERAVSPGRLQQIFSGEDWVPPRASQQCGASLVEAQDSLVEAQGDSLVEAQDSLVEAQDSLVEAQDSLVEAQDSLVQALQRSQDRIGDLEERLEILIGGPDQNPEEIRRLREEIQRVQEENRTREEEIQRVQEESRRVREETQRVQDELQSQIDSLRALAEDERSGLPLWATVMGISILAALGLMGVVRLRSGARAGAAVVEPPPDHDRQPAPPQIAPAPPSAPSVSLEGRDKDGNRFSVVVPGDSLDSQEGVVVGRNPYQSKVVIDHPEVSRRHFRMSFSGGRILVEDLGSTNKTMVGNAVLTPGVRAELRDGDTLHVGSLALRPTIQR